MEISFTQTEYNVIKTRTQLLQIVLKLCESDAIAAISSINFWVDDIWLNTPSPRDKISMESDDSREEYDLETDLDSVRNKLAGLYVKKGDYQEYQIKKDCHISNPDWQEVKVSYYIEPGLKGIKRCVTDLALLNEGEKDKLPIFLRDLLMDYFRFTVGVVWEKNRDSRTSEDGAIIFTDYDSDYISGKCDSSNFWFVISDRDDDSLKVFNTTPYVSHLNRIQKVLDDVEPKKFNIHPMYCNVDLLEMGVLNRNNKGFYSISDLEFEEAEKQYHQEFYKYYQEENRKMMQKIDKDIAKYEEMEVKGDLKAKQRRERLHEMKTVMASLAKISDNIVETDEDKKEGSKALD